jgi:hypothetical protein
MISNIPRFQTYLHLTHLGLIKKKKINQSHDNPGTHTLAKTKKKLYVWQKKKIDRKYIIFTTF